MKGVILGIAIVAAVAGGVFVWRYSERPPAPLEAVKREGTVTVTRRLAPDAVLSIKPGAPMKSAVVPAGATRLSPLLQEYYSGKGWKALYDRLRNAPARTAEESYLMAEMLDRCAKVTDRKVASNWMKQGNRDEERKRFLATVSDKDPNAAQRIAAHDKMGSVVRCEGFDGVTTTEGEIRDLLQSGASDPKARARLVEKEIAATLPPEGTPMMSSDGTSSLPTITDAQLEALKQAVQSGDPQALSIAARVFSSTMQNLAIRVGPGEQPVDPRAFYDAWALAACDLGQPCGAESGRLMHSCATQGNCGAQDLREHMFFFDHSPQQSQRLADYHAQIMQAARTGDWSYFTFHRGPPPRGWVSIFIVR